MNYGKEKEKKICKNKLEKRRKKERKKKFKLK